MTLTHEGVAISGAAAATGLSTHTLRYYERAGLMLDPVDRASSSHRRYSETDIGWVQFLTRLRSTGMPIATIREYTELVRRGDATVGARRELLVRHRIAVLHQLDDISASLAAIDIKIAIYEEKVAHA
jgi:DNA-binding transcriptional MerR regulator